MKTAMRYIRHSKSLVNRLITDTFGGFNISPIMNSPDLFKVNRTPLENIFASGWSVMMVWPRFPPDSRWRMFKVAPLLFWCPKTLPAFFIISSCCFSFDKTIGTLVPMQLLAGSPQICTKWTVKFPAAESMSPPSVCRLYNIWVPSLPRIFSRRPRCHISRGHRQSLLPCSGNLVRLSAHPYASPGEQAH